MSNYHEKYKVKKGESPLVKTTVLIKRNQYEALKKIKEEWGISTNFFIQKAIDKALLEREKEKNILKKRKKTG